jgi:glycosyltransferase involved in cell wall biosynthesis
MIPKEAGGDQVNMNTLLVVPWDEQRGGVISVVDNLARYLLARGHNVLFFHTAKTVLLRRRLTKLGFSGVQLRLNMPLGAGLKGWIRTIAFPFLLIASLSQLLWFLRTNRIQIVNIHYPNDNFFYFAVCRRLLNIRLITSVHGRDAFYREKPKERYSWPFRFLIRSSDLVILPSDSYRKKMLEAFPDIWNKTIFIHNGINPAQFQPAETEKSTDQANRYILCIAELQEYKAIDVLLHAAKPLLRGDPSLKLMLAGDGPLRAELEALASSLGVRNRISFLGTQGAAQIVQLLHGCEVLVLPSRMEPFGIVLIEAMACKKPVVATAVGGIPEIVEHEITGILVEPENPQALAAGLQRVLTDGDLRRTIAQNGHFRAMERFCSTHNGAAYESAFASILGIQNPSPHPTSKIPATGI